MLLLRCSVVALALGAGVLVVGFRHPPPACERAAQVYAQRAEPEVMAALAVTYDLDVARPRDDTGRESFVVSHRDTLVGWAASPPGSTFRCRH